MVKPAQLFTNLQYDNTMDQEGALEVYLKRFNGEITSIIRGSHEKSKTVVEKLYGNTKLNIYCEDNINNSLFEPKMSVKRDFIVKIGNTEKSLSGLFCEVEFKGRSIPAQETLKYDIALMNEYFHYYSKIANFSCKSSDLQEVCVLLFSNNSSLSLLAIVASSLLAEGYPVAIVATREVALLAHIFTTMLLDAGVSNELIDLLIIENEEKIQQLKTGHNHVIDLNTREGCSVVVTETSDIDSVIGMLVSQATRTHVYPWRVDRLLVQESVYEAFQKSLEDKFISAEQVDFSNFSLPLGAKALLYPKQYKNSKMQFLISQNINLREDARNVTTMQAYRSTKELLNLINQSKSVFALSLWCDSVSITNEITLGANVPVVWINTYGKMNPSVSIKIRETFGPVLGGELGNKRLSIVKHFNKDIPECDAIPAMKRLQEKVKLAQARLAKWKLLDSSTQFDMLATSLKGIPALTKEEEDSLEKMLQQVKEHIKFNSEGKVIGNYLLTQTLQGVGIILVHIENGTKELVTVIASIFRGNAVICHLHKSDSNYKIIECLSKTLGIPILLEDEIYVFDIANRIHEIKSVRIYQQSLLPVLYNTKTVWSPVGETFAN